MKRSAKELTRLDDRMSRRGFLKRAGYFGLAAATLPWLMRNWTDSALAAIDIQDLDVFVNTPSTAPPSSTSGGSPVEPSSVRLRGAP